ncbi:methyl-accepting chemotaxis protein [Aquipseudomonas alcaligenes]|uniref:Methyl-accepting chemotaxis protein n=1 Tax=Aquipseudomonas alcaligenes TaxID=43263 RepID=A0A2V4L3W5_AQUAC|nr:methyl-accepting chemotaxis protein [Pseudomonas alcaligenes]PYC27569.1 methyl-accepting chemotaxis protein [Pseudomonas alcaligenes]
MKSWKIRTHLFLLIGTLLSSLLLVGLLGLHGLQSTVRGLETVYLDRVVPLRDLKLIADLYAVNIVDATHKANSGSLSSSAAQALIVQARSDIDKTWQAYLDTQLIAEEQRLIAEIKPLMAAAEAPLDHLQDLLRQEQREATREFADQRLYPLIDPLSAKFAELIEVQLGEARHQYERGQATYTRDLRLSLGLLLLALLLGGAQALYFARLLRLQLGAEPGELEAISARIAAGQLDSQASLERASSGVMKSVQSMHHGLRDMIGNIGEASEQIECASLQLAASSEQVLNSANVQSDTASAIAATMEEMAVSISQIAENAQQTRDMAEKAGQLSDHGLEVTAAAIEEMRSIAGLVLQSSADLEQLAAQSANISAIVDVIKGIAEQTNLLALNAAIEAARAGEQGRGFAVVADEVRSLASRTAQSTTEIVSLVGSIQGGVEQARSSMGLGRERLGSGTRLVEQAGTAMQDIRAALSESLDAVNVISLSLQEQRAASEQVAANVERVAQIVEENSAAQGGIVQAIQALQAMSGRLQGMLRRFSY